MGCYHLAGSVQEPPLAIGYVSFIRCVANCGKLLARAIYEFQGCRQVLKKPVLPHCRSLLVNSLMPRTGVANNPREGPPDGGCPDLSLKSEEDGSSRPVARLDAAFFP